MERKEFMKSIGAGAAFAVTFGCLGGCLREELDPLSQTDPLAGSTPTDSIAEVPVSTDSTETVIETTPETIPQTTAEAAPETVTDTVQETTPETVAETTPEVTPDPSPPSNALFTIDLTSSEASKLAEKGGYIIKNKIVVAKNLDGNYVAATVICSHDLLKKMIFKNNEYYCTEHSARFDQSGKGLNSKGKRGLKIYETSLNGNSLSVFA